MFAKDLASEGERLGNDYQKGLPFPHIVLDGFFDEELVTAAASDFPSDPREDLWWKYDSPGEKKWAYRNPHKAPATIVRLLEAMNSDPFVSFLETLTSVPKLISDPEFHGGGLHRIPPGGKLFMHADFPLRPDKPKPHPLYPDASKEPLYRRVNALLYLNPGWEEGYGGHLELRGGTRAADNTPILNLEKMRILPVFNRLIIFTVAPSTYHGHPDPLQCPPDLARCSLATYYFTREEPPGAEREMRKALFWPRPGYPEDTPKIRQWCRQRAKP